MPTEKVIVITGGSSGIGAATAPHVDINEVLVRPTSQTI